MNMTKAIFLDKTEVLLHILFIIRCLPVVLSTQVLCSQRRFGACLSYSKKRHSMALEEIFISAALSIGAQLSYKSSVLFSSST